MRSMMMTGIGFLVMGAFVLAGLAAPSLRKLLLGAFVLLWLAWCLYDSWLGTTHGFSWGTELAVHAPIFLLPAIVAWVLQRR